MQRELLARYHLPPGRYDEVFENEGIPRPQWRAAFEELAAAPPEALSQRLQSVQRELRESGVTHNALADPQGGIRPWELDLLPLIITEAEWHEIESAVAQRASLLDAVLRDLYGEQRLLAEGLIPPALVYGHPGFLRPLAGVPAPGDAMLHMYAADLARSPDGRWWVVGDRTQAPWGAGYALENRVVVSRVSTELFHDLKVRRLAGFFAEMRDSLAQWAPAGATPFPVLLTSGHRSDTYFEQTYLARYLGFPLVEGGDLTVREGKVWLKTLAGLQRVSAILRHLHDDQCDPLELHGDSSLGVPGLIGAVRSGSVRVANALGSGLLESGALLGYLPRLCERLLGAPLAMPSVATWWCGEPAAMYQVEALLDALAVKAAYPQGRGDSLYVDELDADARAKLLYAMRARPERYLAQELVRLSQAPVVDSHHPRQLQPRVIGLRVFACATPHGYVVMPGGLAQASLGSDSRALASPRGATSKDVWVLSSAPVSAFSLLRRELRAADLQRTGANLSSRVTENLFWMGRLSERCDDSARLLRAVLGRYVDLTATERGPDSAAMLDLLRRAEILAEALPDEDEAALLGALRDAIENDARPGLAGTLRQLLEVAAQLRDRLSTDNWRTLNNVARQLERLRRRQHPLPDLLAELDRDITAFMTLSGFALDGMTRDTGWRFLSLGRRIERLHFITLAVQAALAGAADMDLDWLLEVGDSSITYRSRYMARPQWMPVLDLLVRDVSNPHSVAFQLKGLEEFLKRISEAYDGFDAARFGLVREGLESLDVERDLQHGSPRLVALLWDCHARALRLSEDIALRFFAHAGEVSRQTIAT